MRFGNDGRGVITRTPNRYNALPFDAMMRVIQNLGGTAAVQGGFAGFPGGGFGGGFGGFGGGAGGRPGRGGAGATSDPAGLVSLSVGATARPQASV